MKSQKMFVYLIIMSILGLFFSGCASTGKNSSSSNPTATSSENTTTTEKKEEEIPKTPFELSIVNEGSSDKIAKVMNRAKNGEAITFGVIGGSISAGATADPLQSYVDLVLNWWREKFPNTQFFLANASIGATKSIYGAQRVARDLLAKNPDFVIVEFSVNDTNTDNTKESYEGLIRQILASNKTPGVLSLAMCAQNGSTWQDVHYDVAKQYNVPMISLKNGYYQRLVDKTDPELTLQSFWADDVHPNTLGHKTVAGLVTNYLDSVYDSLKENIEVSKDLPDPITENGYEKSVIYDSTNLVPLSSNGWTNNSNNWGKGWKTQNTGGTLKFNLDGGYITLYYKRDNAGAGGKVKVIIDGDESKAITVDANFANGWGNYIESIDLLHSKEKGSHTVEFVFENQADKEFIISNIIASNLK